MASVDVAEASRMSARFLVALLAVSCAVPAQSSVESDAMEFLQRFDANATELMYKYSLASWAYNTNITNENSDKVVSGWIKPSDPKHSYLLKSLVVCQQFA